MVPFQDWDSFILGTTAEIHREMLAAGSIAERETERWRRGRFPSIQLAVADAAFSKVRDYEVAVRNCIRPFARAFADTPLQVFAALPWSQVFLAVFDRTPTGTDEHQHHHLSNEGRIQSTVSGAQTFLRLGLDTPVRVRARLAEPNGEVSIRRALESVPGLGPALHAYLLMNLGRMTLKADRHVIRVVAPYLDLAPDASPSDFEQALHHVAPKLGRSPFEIDQILWYTEAESRKLRSEPTAPARATKDIGMTKEPDATSPRAPIAGRKLVGSVVDIQPNKDTPVLELRFAKNDAECLPATNRSPLALTINGVPWNGTIGITGTNPPYVHTKLKSKGAERSMTDLLRTMGVREKGQIEFECVGKGDLRFVRVIDPGQWRIGNELGPRASF